MASSYACGFRNGYVFVVFNAVVVFALLKGYLEIFVAIILILTEVKRSFLRFYNNFSAY